MADFPNTVGSWWVYEVTTERISDSDTTGSVDTITATITHTCLMDDGRTPASVWQYDPYFIDADELRPESLIVTSLGVSTRFVGDTIRLYRSTGMSSLRHTILLKEYTPPDSSQIIVGTLDCAVSRTNGTASVSVPAGEYRETYTVGSSCFGWYITVPDGEEGIYQRQRTMYFQRRIGVVKVRQYHKHSALGTTRYTWDLVSYHLEAR